MPEESVPGTGTHARTDTVHLRKAISQATGLGELLPLVAMLSQETETLMNGRKLSENDIHRIAAPLAHIRSLLTTLAPLGCETDGSFREDALVRDLLERYRDAEGRIKEMRNDLARAKKPCIP